MKYILFTIICFVFFACTNKQNTHKEQDLNNATTKNIENTLLAPDEFVQWVKEKRHGLKKEKTIGDIIFSAQYKPAEYIICMEERSSHIADSIAKRKIPELENMLYIDFKISLKNEMGELLKHELSSASEYEKRVNYYSFKMPNDVKLIEGNDTIPCELFHFERTYDIAPYCTFVLGFPKKINNNTDKTLIYHDTIFKKGIIKLEFEDKDFQSVPKLQTE